MGNTILNYKGKSVYIIFDEDRDVIGCYVTYKKAKDSLIEGVGKKEVDIELNDGTISIEKVNINL